MRDRDATTGLIDDIVDPALAAAVLEIEHHIAGGGWDQPARLYALVDTAELVEREPELAQRWAWTRPRPRLADAGRAGPARRRRPPLEGCWSRSPGPTAWPGCAAVVERLVLPPEADDQIPDDPRGARRSPASTPNARKCASSRAPPAPVRRTVHCGCEPTTTTSRSWRAPTWCRRCWSCCATRWRNASPRTRTTVSELFDDDLPEKPAARRAAAEPVARADDHRPGAGGGVLLADHLRLVYTDRLWYRADGYGEVFSTLFWTRVGLFLVFGAADGAGSAPTCTSPTGSARCSGRLARADRPGPLPRRRHARSAPGCSLGVSLVLGLFAGTSATGQWRTYLLWRNGTASARTTRTSTRTSASTSSTCRGCTTWSTSRWRSLVVALLAAAMVHYLYGGIRLQTPARPAVRRRAGAVLGAAGALRARQGGRLLARPLRPGQRPGR